MKTFNEWLQENVGPNVTAKAVELGGSFTPPNTYTFPVDYDKDSVAEFGDFLTGLGIKFDVQDISAKGVLSHTIVKILG